MNIQLVIAFLTYFGILFAIGGISYLRTQSSTDFMIGNRGVNFWVTAIAAHASDMSAWLFMAFPAAIYTNGLVGSWIAVGLLGGMFFSWHYVAQKLRVMTEHYNVVTLSSFFQKRFADDSNLIPVISSIVIMIFFTFYIAAGLTGMGDVFESVFGMNYHVGMTIALIVSLLYMLVGGFLALAWNHFFQGMFLLSAIVVVPLYALYQLGSIQPIVDQATARDISLKILPELTTNSIIKMINGVMWGIGYLGMPHVVVNYMGIDNPAHIKRAKYFGMIWLTISLFCAVAVGFVGIGYFPTLANNELVFVELVKQLFNPLLTGFILCAVLAATMSTIDTQILVASSSLTQDVYKRAFHRTATEKELLWVSRVCIIGVALLGYCLAIPKSDTVMGLVSYAWSGLASAFSPLMIAALYSTNINRNGALASLVVGALVSGLWPLVNAEILPLIPGVIASTVALYLGSKIKS